MLDLIRSIISVVEEGFLLVVALLVIVGCIGGRRGLRNPWVYGPLFVSAGAFFFGLYLAYLADHRPPGSIHRPQNGPEMVVTAIVVGCILTGPIVAAIAGVRRGNRIDRLLHLPEMRLDPEHALQDLNWHSERVRHLAETLVTTDDLNALLPLVRQMDGAPGYNWLTEEWIRERIALTSPRSAPQLKRHSDAPAPTG